jgi:hypothetical protein
MHCSRNTVAVLSLLLGSALHAQTGSPGAVKDPSALVRRAVANEVKSSTNDPRMMFRVRKQTPKGVQTREYVETKDGTAGMMVAVNDKPLSPAERQQEFARLDQLLNNPQELRRKQKQQKEDSGRVVRMLQALPDAFIYRFQGRAKAKNGDELVRLNFEPNPNYDPPSREQQVFTGMNGFLLIDATRERIARIDGTLFRDVGFGWGILGHLDRGGRFVVEQGDVGSGLWETTHMQLAFTGKALFFKAINIQSVEDSAHFRKLANDLTFAQGVDLLKKRDGEVAENQGTR